MVNLICALYDIQADRQWAAVLQSPLFGISDEGLFWIRQYYPKHSVFEGILDPDGLLAENSASLSPLDQRLLADAQSRIPSWVSRLKWEAPDTLCRDIYKDRELWTLSCSRDEHAIAKLEKCLHQVHQWHKTRHTHQRPIPSLLLHHFKNRKLVGPPSPPAENAVQLMTIHHSKGLEFPVVFLPFLEKGFNYNLSDPFLISSKHGAALSYKRSEDTNPWRQHVSEQLKKDGLLEETRLFYVACTRAKEALILVGHAKKQLKHSFLKQITDHCTPLFVEKKALFFQKDVDQLEMPLYDIDLYSERVNMISKHAMDVQPPTRIKPRPWPKVSSHTLSIANIPQILDCPKRYRLRSLIPPSYYEEDRDGFAATIGTLVHELLSFAADTKRRSPGDPDTLPLDHCPAEAIPTVLEHYASVFQMPFWTESLTASRIETEYPFTLHDNLLSISGRIDMLYIIENTIYIVDYKTFSKPDTMSVSHQSQLALYVLAIQTQFPTHQVNAGIVYTGSGDYVELDNPEKTAFMVLDRLRQRLFADSEQPSDPKLCETCPISAYFKDCAKTST